MSGAPPDGPLAAPRPRHGAVFLSYASQDADAAQRLCNGLRAAGIEVWFDRSELRGGDAWDQQIRRRIRDCALFVPLISRGTDARLEGYFRREWKLAVERTHDMAEELAFLVPVAIDTIDERTASVPDRFRAVQWTHLAAGQPTAAFIERLALLLAAPAARPEAGLEAQPSTPSRSAYSPRAAGARQRRPWVFAAIAGCAILFLAAAAFLARDHLRAPPPREPSSASSATPPAHSVAVLPFANLSGDAAQDYFSDGLSEEILNSLARIDGLRVAARTSSFSFKGQNTGAADIARRLNVGALLEGSVRRADQRLRVTVELINASTGFQLWSHAYDAKLDDVLAVQTSIAAAVARELDVALSGNALARIGAGGTRDAAAFDAYLQGTHLMSHAMGIPEWTRAIAAFDAAIVRDPRFAAAYMLRAIELTDICVSTEDFAALPKLRADALASAEQAIALAPELGDAYATRGFVRNVALLDFGTAADFDRALKLAPGSALVQSRYATYAAFIGDPTAALEADRHARELDPENAAVQWNHVLDLTFASRWSDALAAIDERERATPNPGWESIRADVYLGMGRAADAARICEATLSGPDPMYACLAIAYRTLGRQADAERALRSLMTKHGDQDAFTYAEIYSRWGDRPEALHWLDVAARLRLGSLQHLRTSRDLDPLRAEPAYLAIERELHFPPAR